MFLFSQTGDIERIAVVIGIAGFFPVSFRWRRKVLSIGNIICVKADLMVWRSLLKDYNAQTLSGNGGVKWGIGVVYWFFRLQCYLWRGMVCRCMASWLGFKGFCRNMTLLKLFPIVVTVDIWGSVMKEKRVCSWSDNLGVICCKNNLSSSSLSVLLLLRHLVRRCLNYNICFRSCHVPDVDNSVADVLSHFLWQVFSCLLPGSFLEGHRCPPFL